LLIFNVNHEQKKAEPPQLSGDVENRPAVSANCGTLTERDADTALLAPRDVAGPMQSIARYNQYEFLRNADLVGHLQRGTGRGQVADQAIDGAAPELNRSSFQHPAAGRSPTFDHGIELLQNPKGSIKRRQRAWWLAITSLQAPWFTPRPLITIGGKSIIGFQQFGDIQSTRGGCEVARTHQFSNQKPRRP
jgi:hypothetical protein